MLRLKRSSRETLQLIGTVEDLAGVWEALGFTTTLRPSSSKSSITDSAGLDNLSNRTSEDDAGSTDETEKQRRLWTQHVLADISCDGKFLVLASQKEISILTARWKNERLIFSKLWNGVLADGIIDATSEVLTCCLALPLHSRQRSSDGLPDWTCVIYGFKSGFVAFHTETGYPVHRQQFDINEVRLIKMCSPLRPGSGSDVQGNQELMVLYENGAVVIIDGMHLYASLQSFKYQAAAASSKGKGEDDDVEVNTIPHEKFQLDSRQDLRDIISLGSSRISGFDQLLNASVLGGKQAMIKTPLPSFRRFIAVGTNPLYSSYYIMEGDAPLIIGQVAKDIAAKVTSAVTSRISATASRFGLQGLLNRAIPSTKDLAEKKSKPVPKLGRRVQPRFNIYDARRIATNIVLSGSYRLAALTDNFGRVLLMDCATGVVVRMWKGYRSAEVAWMTVIDPKSDEASPRFVECLVIYAPRRHLLEVWTALSFRRLLALHVSQGLRVLPVGSHVLGQQVPSSDSTFLQSKCYFLDLTGNLYALNVPFYLVEEGINETDGQDELALQKVRELIITSHDLRSKDVELMELLGNIVSWEAKDQAVQFLIGSQSGETTADLIVRVLQQELTESRKVPPVEFTDGLRRIWRNWAETVEVLRWFGQIEAAWENGAIDQPETGADVVLEGLNAGTLFSTIGLVTKFATTSPTDDHKIPFNWQQFLHCLDRKPDHGDDEWIFCVSEDLDLTDRRKLGWYLFGPYFRRKVNLTRVLHDLKCLDFSEATSLLVVTWLWDGSVQYDEESLRLLEQLLTALLGGLQPSEIRVHRTAIQESTNVPAALLLALSFLSAAFQQPSMDRSNSGESDDWESVCKEKIEWARLSHRLESLLSLKAVLARFVKAGKSYTEASSVSVRDFAHRGKSAAAEYLASWMARGFLDIPPAAIMKAFYSADLEIRLQSSESEDRDDRPLRFMTIPEVSLDHREISEALCVLKAIFPKSLTPDVLLSNCSWELALMWHKKPENTSVLRRSLVYLKDVVSGELLHGVALLIWKTFISHTVSMCATLMEKVGKTPTERLFIREVGLPEAAVVDLIELGHTLLGYIFDADYEIRRNPALDIEYLWLADSSSSKSSLAELAFSQPSSNAALVHHHMILLSVLHIILYYSLKNARPLTLFDFKARDAFFKDFSTQPLLSIIDLDQTTIRLRTQFLDRALSGLVRLAAEHCCQPDLAWFERIVEIARYWGINIDEVRSLYVVALYSHGLDDFGEEAYKSITEKQDLLPRLLNLAGQRIAALTNNTTSQTDYANYLSSMSPDLGAWIRPLNSNALANQNTDWERTYLLVRNISHDMNRHQFEYKLCSELLEWIQSHILTR